MFCMQALIKDTNPTVTKGSFANITRLVKSSQVRPFHITINILIPLQYHCLMLAFRKLYTLDFQPNLYNNYNTPLFDEISFEIGSADVNATHQITLAHLLDSQLSSIDTLGINRIDENATIKSLETTAGGMAPSCYLPE